MPNVYNIAVHRNGKLFVTDSETHHVQVADHDNNSYTPDGEVLAVIDSKGEGNSRLNTPYGVYVGTNNILYVTEWYT